MDKDARYSALSLPGRLLAACVCSPGFGLAPPQLYQSKINSSTGPRIRLILHLIGTPRKVHPKLTRHWNRANLNKLRTLRIWRFGEIFCKIWSAHAAITGHQLTTTPLTYVTNLSCSSEASRGECCMQTGRLFQATFLGGWTAGALCWERSTATTVRSEEGSEPALNRLLDMIS